MVTSTAHDLTWVDDTSQETMLTLLERYGVQIAGEIHNIVPDPPPEGVPTYQLFPIGNAWLRIEMDADGRLWGSMVPDARYPEKTDGSPPIRFDDDSEDLQGWMTTRADIDASGQRWVSVLRRPEREAYIALVYDAAVDRPRRSLLMKGIYPDVSLLDDGRLVAFVEPDGAVIGGQRAVLAKADVKEHDRSRRVLAQSSTGGIGVKPCAVRRFLKISHGIRSERVWDLVDVHQVHPRLITVPGTPNNPNLFDVALLDDEPVLVQVFNGDGSWTLQSSIIDQGRILRSWVCATGIGQAREVSSGLDHVIVRVSKNGEETLHRIGIEGFSSGREPLLATQGLLDLRSNQVTPSIGFAATEMRGGIPPYTWFFDQEGGCRNDPVEVERRASGLAQAARETITSDDGYLVDMDLRWPASSGSRHEGPVILMLYGAYGLDIDLDSDPDLGQWLGRGYAVATPHVRGGGPERRHLAGTRAKRDRSLADAAAAIRYLRAGQGAVTATQLVTLGASAGGFLSAAMLNETGTDVDVCVIVNGFVDPLTSLLREDSRTAASDRDEWGDPAANANDFETLRRISPVENLRDHYDAEVLIVVSGCDVRVNPRQGLKWFMRYRELGGRGEMWFDPHGAHDCWGAGMPRTALADWVDAALKRSRTRRQRG